MDDRTPLRQLLDHVARPVRCRGRRVRALRIGDAHDLGLLRAISRGGFATAGFRNRDLCRLRHPTPRHPTTGETRPHSARMSRALRLLRAHGVLEAIPNAHRYRLTHNGHLLTAAVFAVREATLEQLVGAAAA